MQYTPRSPVRDRSAAKLNIQLYPRARLPRAAAPRQSLGFSSTTLRTQTRSSRSYVSHSSPAHPTSPTRGRQPRDALLAHASPRLATDHRQDPTLGRFLDAASRIGLLKDSGRRILGLLALLHALFHPCRPRIRITHAAPRLPACRSRPFPALHPVSDETPDRAPDEPSQRSFARMKIVSTEESRRRAFHVLSILEARATAYASGSLASSPAGLALWLERTWHALGAPRFLDANSFANCEAFFATLAQMPPSCFGTLDKPEPAARGAIRAAGSHRPRKLRSAADDHSRRERTGVRGGPGAAAPQNWQDRRLTTLSLAGTKTPRNNGR